MKTSWHYSVRCRNSERVYLGKKKCDGWTLGSDFGFRYTNKGWKFAISFHLVACFFVLRPPKVSLMSLITCHPMYFFSCLCGFSSSNDAVSFDHISNANQQSHANVIRKFRFLFFFFAGATVVSWRVNNQEQLFVRWVNVIAIQSIFNRRQSQRANFPQTSDVRAKKCAENANITQAFFYCRCRRGHQLRHERWSKNSNASHSSGSNLVASCRFLVWQSGKNLTRHQSPANTASEIVERKQLAIWMAMWSFISSVGSTLFVRFIR